MKKCSMGCGEPVNEDDKDTYRQVVSWVHGPKLDGPVLREQTGNVAHKECVQRLMAGQAADQPGLFEESWGGNGDADCTCGTNPHRDWCPRFGR